MSEILQFFSSRYDFGLMFSPCLFATINTLVIFIKFLVIFLNLFGRYEQFLQEGKLLEVSLVPSPCTSLCELAFYILYST